MNADRLLTLRLVFPFRKALGRAGEDGSIPVLMYHQVADEPSRKTVPYFDTVTSARAFESHLDFLERERYSVVGLGEAADRLRSGGRTGGRCAVITFDDGFLGVHRNAFPLLRARRFGATVFLVTSCVGRKSVTGAEFLGWKEAREMAESGIEFGSHTVDHPKLACLDEAGLRHQVTASKAAIERNLGTAVKAISYPYAFPEGNGAFRRSLETALVEAGYERGVTTVVGRNFPGGNPFFLKRIPVNSCDDPLLFRAKLEGAYDWVRWAQYLVKTGKRIAGRGRGAVRNETFVPADPVPERE
jgi:peptidoglycan/xylan/chitin deacetylase (PgdA/CDA1 family)